MINNSKETVRFAFQWANERKKIILNYMINRIFDHFYDGFKFD